MTTQPLEDLGFTAWMAAVDREVIRTSGVSAHDLADQTWRDWFNAEMTPAEAAQEALENEGFPYDDAA